MKTEFSEQKRYSRKNFFNIFGKSLISSAFLGILPSNLFKDRSKKIDLKIEPNPTSVKRNNKG
ncbi:MAG: hypothetical protein N3A61_03415 [Ignavibacteria bacterium]|nr:hypothetical protein [Ignavibacteria bacterium]